MSYAFSGREMMNRLVRAGLSTAIVDGLFSSVLSSATAIVVTGTCNSSTGVFTITGGGYTLTGVLANGTISGSYTGASTSGVFSMQQGAASAMTVYCGTYAGTTSGKWNLVEGSGGKLSGGASPGPTLVGPRTANSITLTYTGGSAT